MTRPSERQLLRSVLRARMTQSLRQEIIGQYWPKLSSRLRSQIWTAAFRADAQIRHDERWENLGRRTRRVIIKALRKIVGLDDA